MKDDCFACAEKNVFIRGAMERVKGCTALNEAMCAKKRFDGFCPFYKPREDWEKYMLEHHGTTDLNAVVSAYQRTFGGN